MDQIEEFNIIKECLNKHETERIGKDIEAFFGLSNDSYIKFLESNLITSKVIFDTNIYTILPSKLIEWILVSRNNKDLEQVINTFFDKVFDYQEKLLEL